MVHLEKLFSQGKLTLQPCLGYERDSFKGWSLKIAFEFNIVVIGHNIDVHLVMLAILEIQAYVLDTE